MTTADDSAPRPASEPPALAVTPSSPMVSVVIPVYDERPNLALLGRSVVSTLEGCGIHFEVLFIDDGSTDGSEVVLEELSAADSRIRAYRFRTNSGKSAALAAGFQRARGEIVVTMDGDLQDDPAEIPNFLRRLEDGHDLVAGWRTPRHDSLLKVFLSRVYNRVTRALTGVPLHDFNCGFKAYRREPVARFRLYGDLHRYIPVMLARQGYRVCELPIRHHPRRHGRSKYGPARIVRGFLDLMTVLFLTRYGLRPLHLLGGAGLLMALAGITINVYLAVLWSLGHPIGNRPLLLLGVLLTLAGIQCLLFGLLAELVLHLAGREEFEVVAVPVGDPTQEVTG
jgi:glycosyltransferase involved in cell wall biosynthesis